MQASTATCCLSEGSANNDDRPRCSRLLAAAVAVVPLVSMLVGCGGEAVSTATPTASITVNSTADDTNPGHCTLREAINSANHGASSDTGSCRAGDGNDAIKFRVRGTIMLGSTLPDFVRTLTIAGPTPKPSGIVIDGGGKYQVMSVSSGATVKLANLTIENGFATGSTSETRAFGAGILNKGTLTVVNCAFSDNSAGTGMIGSYGFGGGLANFGTLTVTNSIFSGNHADGLGGGIYNDTVGTLTVSDSTLSGNTVGRPNLNVSGGAIFNYGTLAVTDSTFSSNSANNLGGGISAGRRSATNITNSTFSGNTTFFLGGGIFDGGTLTVTNSTFFSNMASGTERGEPIGSGGGVAAGDTTGTVAVTSSTFLANSANNLGGGIFNRDSGTSGPLSVKSTILANNTISSDDTPENCGGPITDVGYNISDDNSCGFSASSSRNNTDPELDPAGLSDNGGPTETIALQSSSAAIDAIPLHDCTDQASPPSRISTDQRGALRPDAGEVSCDIGAYEFQDFQHLGRALCQRKSVSALIEQYGSLGKAASAYGFPSVNALRVAILTSCRG